MKNKNFIINFLIVGIIVLSGVTALYAFSNRDRIFASKAVDVNKQKVEEKPTSSDSTVMVEPAVPTEPEYVSDNRSDNPGLKVISSYDEYSSLVSKDTNTFFVFGREGCHYCELYKPVLQEVAALYKIEVAYIDMAKLSSDDYYNVLHSGLMIPAKCSKMGEDVDISNGFGTPLTLFVNSSSTYDCIRGYKDKSNLINILKEIKFIN